MDKIDSKLVLIIFLLALNIYQIVSARFQSEPTDVTNVFLKDKMKEEDLIVKSYLRYKHHS